MARPVSEPGGCIRARLGISAAALTLFIGVSPATSNTRTHYQHVYEHVDRANAGPYAGGVAGRNLADDGVLTKHGTRRATGAELRDSIGTMKLMLHPPAPYVPAVAPVAPTTTYTPPAPVPTSSVGGCVGMEAESGSAGYSAYNPSSGATGCYQIIPSTAAAHGCDLSTPAGQDACAATICATEGSGAWASSGANPC